LSISIETSLNRNPSALLSVCGQDSKDWHVSLQEVAVADRADSNTAHATICRIVVRALTALQQIHYFIFLTFLALQQR